MSQNFIRNSLPPADYDWLRPLLKEVELQPREIIYCLNEPVTAVYFPTTCLLSLTNSTAKGEAIDLGVTGFEGVSDVSLFLGENRSSYQVEVQLSGKAFKLSTPDFLTALDRSTTLRQRVASFTHFKMVQLTQSGLCSRFHLVEERLCRWILDAQDRAKTSEFSLTREVLATMIGSGRPTVSTITGTLQAAGLIQANRGKITTLNREEMEAATCECYRIVKAEFDRYLAKQIRL